MNPSPTPLSLLKHALDDRDELQVRLIVGNVPVAQRQSLIRACCERDDAEALAWMGTNLTEELFNLAAEHGAVAVMRYALPELTSHSWWRSHYGLSKAVRGGHEDMVVLLAQASGGHGRHTGALVEAIRKERLDLVDALIPVCDPNHHQAIALREALLQGNYPILARLSTLCDAALAGEALARVVTVEDPRQANPGQFSEDQRWAALDYLGALVDAPQRYRWLAEHGDQKLPGIARQVLSDLRLKALDERPTSTPSARRTRPRS